jgi:hypothetical protein
MADTQSQFSSIGTAFCSYGRAKSPILSVHKTSSIQFTFNTMKNTFKLLGATLLGVAWSGALYAGHTNFDFTIDPVLTGNDPTGNPLFYFAGAHNHNNPASPDYYWRASNGNPGGYMALTDNQNNDSLIVVLPQVDFYTNASAVVTPSPIRNFKIDVDVRVGNPTNGNSAPADGFSFSFARSTDPALLNAINGTLYGFAGGANLAEAQAGPNPTGGSYNTPENGVRQGVSIVFDAHQGNFLPDTPPSDGTSPLPLPGHSNDREGITARFDDKTLVQLNFGTAHENGACSNLFSVTATNACAVNLTSCNDLSSLQTGPFGGAANTVGAALLCWKHLSITLSNKVLTVVWKGSTNITTTLSNWTGGTGRFLLAGRTGGDNQIMHFDNLVIDTTPFNTSFLNPTVGNSYGFIFNVQDFGDSIVTNISQVFLDGADVTSQIVLSNSAPYTSGIYTQAAPFAAASTHTVAVTWQTRLGEVLSATNQFTVAAYLAVPSSFLVPLSAIDTNQPGFLVRSHQSYQHAGTSARYGEEQLLGLHGANIADQTQATHGGLFSWAGAIDFMTTSGAAAAQGLLIGNNDFNNFGIGPVTGSGANGTTTEPDFAVEFFAYVYFPTNGFYTIVLAGDDAHQLRFSRNPMDKFGQIAEGTDVNLMMTTATPPAVGGDEATFYVSQAGCLPIRILQQNSGSDGALEAYTINPDGTFSGLNDVNDPNALLCYQVSSVSGPYVKSAVPVWDAQNVTFYQPIVLQLGDGTGNMAIDTNTIVLTSASSTSTSLQVTQLVSIANAGPGVTAVVQQRGAYPQWTNWSGAVTVTNVLNFKDLNGTNYAYSWTFNVLNTAANFATNAVPIPASIRVDSSLVDATQPGWRIKSWQSAQEPPNVPAWTLEQLEGLHGPNLADQSATNGPGFFIRNDLLDLRIGTGSPAVGSSPGEWGYDLGFDATPGGGYGQFGIGAIANTGGNGNTLAPTFRFTGDNRMETAALDIGAWLVFPAAGNYLMQVNSDDGFIAGFPQGSPFGGLGLPGTYANAALFSGGRGTATTPAGADTGGTLVGFSIPQAGAYPFRLAYYNGGTAGGLELSVYQSLPDGSVAKVPINDPAQSYSIKVYQALAGSDAAAPYLKYMNPVSGALDILPWQPTVIDLADGPGTKTVVPTSIQLRVDGVLAAITKTNPIAGVTHIIEQVGMARTATAHTNVLTYTDNSGASYTNTWAFTVLNNLPFGIPSLPLASMRPTNQVDHSQPGFRVKSYQTTAGPTANYGTWAEEAFAGLHGANIATGVATPPAGYFVWNNEMDFADDIAANAANGEYRYNYFLSQYFGYVLQGGGLAINYTEAIFAGWMEFPTAGLYAVTVNRDDGYRLTCPYGSNPFDEAGQVIAFLDGTGGNGGAAYPPTSGNRFVFNVPAAGAYPLRLIWFNATGGASIEWTIWQYLPDGSMARLLVNDPNTPGALKVYQTLTNGPAPYVAFVTPYPGTALGQQANTFWQSTPIPGSAFAPAVSEANLTINLQDGATTVVTNSVTLTYLGVVQPITISYANGLSTITRVATNGFWPSGGLGPLVLSFTDSANNSYSYPIEIMATPFWGTLTNAVTAQVDTNKPGFKMRIYQLDPKATVGTTVIPTRVHVAEQVLSGVWGTNAVRPTAYTNNGYVNLQGTGPTAGVINFNLLGAAQIGDFVSGGGFADQIWPGVPGFITATVNSDTNNDFVSEILAYVEFPTNGTYFLGVSSDDGFRLWNGWTPPVNKGALVVNSPAALAGIKATVIDGSTVNTPFVSLPLTNAITGDLVLAQGIGFGSTTNGEGCVITNPGQLAGKIAVMYRSGFCGYAQQVANAQAAGALAVVLIQNRPTTEGPFPQEPAISPWAAIPAVQIEQADGNALVATLNNGTNVNATLTPLDYFINPPAVNPVLGQDDVGKGASDITFPVVVQQAGIYPLRLVHFQGGGGGNCEFFSITGTNRVLINDRTATTGPGPGGSGLRAWYALALPTVSVAQVGGNTVITFYGTLQQSPDLSPGSFQDVPGNPTSPYTVPAGQPQQFYRARLAQ